MFGAFPFHPVFVFSDTLLLSNITVVSEWATKKFRIIIILYRCPSLLARVTRFTYKFLRASLDRFKSITKDCFVITKKGGERSVSDVGFAVCRHKFENLKNSCFELD